MWIQQTFQHEAGKPHCERSTYQQPPATLRFFDSAAYGRCAQNDKESGCGLQNAPLRISRVKVKPLRGDLRPALTLLVPAVRESLQPE